MADTANLSLAPRVDVKKVSDLLQYLLKFSSLRSKQIRTIDQYEEVLWISSVPREQGCFAQAWGRDEDHDPDLWLEVQHKTEPELPAFPRVCDGWVDVAKLRNKQSLPELSKKRTRDVPDPDWHDGSEEEPKEITIVEQLADHPQVQAMWDSYVEQRWRPWVKAHDAWGKVNEVYTKLFSIHQAQLRLGEEYELVLGLGLLSWKTPTGQHVRRHFVVADAGLEFEAELGKFMVRPHASGANLRPELDMLSVEEQPVGAEQAAKQGLSASEGPWDSGSVDGVLQSLVHAISSQGEYVNTVAANTPSYNDKPVVEFAPAIILRKRSTKGLVETLRRISDQVENGGDIPGEFADLAEARSTAEGGDMSTSDEPEVEPPSEIFFPKPSNDAQREIVQKIRTANGVLVQGPPGTGKSHTIANLICHLLATPSVTIVVRSSETVLMGRMET